MQVFIIDNPLYTALVMKNTQRNHKDLIYFIENFVRIRTEQGDYPIRLKEYQKNFIKWLIHKHTK